MYLDKQLNLSEEQVVTVTAGSTNIYDQLVAQKIGMQGRQMYALFTVKEAAVAGGSATVTFSIESDNDVAFGSPTILSVTDAIAKATLALGYQFAIPLPIGPSERYLRVKYTVATGPLTSGKFDCSIIEGLQLNTMYPDAI